MSVLEVWAWTEEKRERRPPIHPNSLISSWCGCLKYVTKPYCVSTRQMPTQRMDMVAMYILRACGTVAMSSHVIFMEMPEYRSSGCRARSVMAMMKAMAYRTYWFCKGRKYQ